MPSVSAGGHSGAGPLSLMSCVRESSPLQDFENDGEKIVASKRRFWNPRRWFRKKNKVSEDIPPEISDITKDGQCSRSASELSVVDDQTRRRSSSSMQAGLSVSHDSVFHQLNSGSDLELDAAQSSSSLSISQPLGDRKLQTELSERLRLRRGDISEDDEGLPRSPCNSPTAADHGFLLDKTVAKDLPTKSHSTCSDGSLLSMDDSSEIDEDSLGQHSRHSSKLSLHEKRLDADSDLEIGTSLTSAPLNHSAAHHRVSVRPKRTYGAPRRKKVPQLSTALPVTPEVNEDSSIRSVSPESVVTEPITEFNRNALTEINLKCSSLPLGVVPPYSASKLSRSNSSAGIKSLEAVSMVEEGKGEKLSIFERLFPRKSGRKKKKEEKVKEEVVSKKDEIIHVSSTVISKTVTETSSSSSYVKRENKPSITPRTGAASRQRIQPIDIPSSPKDTRDSATTPQKLSPNASPIHSELENLFKQKQITASPVKPPEELKNKMKIAGLSPLQQRVLSLNDDKEDGFKSLTNFTQKPGKSVTKSHSFKSSKQTVETTHISHEEHEETKKSVIKAASLDSVKCLDESDIKLGLNPAYIKPIAIETEKITSSFNDSVVVSGPSHTAVVNITTTAQNTNEEEVKSTVIKENQISITKIQLKRETNDTKSTIPEFLNMHLNKVEIRPSSNVVLSMRSPKPSEEQNRPKTMFNFDTESMNSKPPTPRKFSKENLEIIDSETQESPSAIQNRFKKNDSKSSSRKSSIISMSPDSPLEKPLFKSRSISLDSLKTDPMEISDKSSQDSLNTPEKKKSDSVVLRKKSLTRHKNDEEPELMKVFARRSLKLKDTEIQQIEESLADTKSRESNKENNSDLLPIEYKSKEDQMIKESEILQNTSPEDQEIQLRKPLNNHIFLSQRAVSLTSTTKTVNTEIVLKKQSSLGERRKTDHWVTNVRKEETASAKSEIISEEMKVETKNFSQRKAEWEKRAQQAQKKTVP